MNSNQDIKKDRKPEKHSLKAWLGNICVNGKPFSKELLVSKKWKIAPIESAHHFDSHDATLLEKAIRSTGKKKLTAISIEKLTHIKNKFEILVSKNNLVKFSNEFGHFDFILKPNDNSFIIICSVCDYFLIAGSPNFIEMATGKSVDQVISDFESFANNNFWSEQQRNNLKNILFFCKQ